MQGLHILEPEQSILAIRDHTCRWRRQQPRGAGNFRGQRGDSRLSRSLLRLSEGVASHPDAKTPHADTRNRQLVNNPNRRRQARGIDRQTAVRLIVEGFFADVYDRITIEPVREPLRQAVATKLSEIPSKTNVAR